MVRGKWRRCLMAACVGVAVAAGTFVGDAWMEARKDARRNAPWMLPEDASLTDDSLDPRIILARGRQLLPLGEPAPNFKLPDIAGDTEWELSELRKDKPVAIILGSFGCDVICNQLNRLAKLYARYRDRAHFVFIYVAEGPHGGLLPEVAEAEAPRARILRGLRHYGIRFPCLLDSSQKAQKDFRGYPMRVVAVDREGRFAWDSGSVFTPLNLDGLERWLRRQPPQPTSETASSASLRRRQADAGG